MPTNTIPLTTNHVPTYLTKNEEIDHDGLHLPLVGTREQCVSEVTQVLCELTKANPYIRRSEQHRVANF